MHLLVCNYLARTSECDYTINFFEIHINKKIEKKLTLRIYNYNCDNTKTTIEMKLQYQLFTFFESTRTTNYIHADNKNLLEHKYFDTLEELFTSIENKGTQMICVAHQGEHEEIHNKLSLYGYTKIDDCDDSAGCFLYATKAV